MENKKNIISPDYAHSVKRFEALRRIAIDGEDADAVLKYADRFLDKIETETLEALEKRPSAERLLEIAADYRAALRFCEMLYQAAELRDVKREKLDELASKLP